MKKEKLMKERLRRDSPILLGIIRNSYRKDVKRDQKKHPTMCQMKTEICLFNKEDVAYLSKILFWRT